jgi:hypothetical protein
MWPVDAEGAGHFGDRSATLRDGLCGNSIHDGALVSSGRSANGLKPGTLYWTRNNA